MVNVVWDPVGRPRADTTTQTVYCAKPLTVEARAAVLHEAMHVIHADELAELPAWRRELATSRYALREWHDRGWRDFDRAAKCLAMALATYLEDAPRAVVECDIPPALNWERWR
jgi:hypothetical protein